MSDASTSLHEALARVVLAGRELPDVLDEVVRIARGAIPGAEATSVTLIRGDRSFTAAFDGQLAMDADELQYERGYGPCMDAARAGETFLVEDMTIDDRWPDYARHAAERGVRSSLSTPLPFQGATIGALNNYSTRVGGFTPADAALAEEVAAFVAVVVGNAEAASRAMEDAANMRRAMATRAVIEQAKGILMERHKITGDQAFTVLTHASQRRNVKLRDVADELVATGELRAG
ncbi:antitermination regulator [Modestobacter sp. VKM Ac-2676]|nr:antitermination regulator [Modestobacter sp. VKM Ac-2676]